MMRQTGFRLLSLSLVLALVGCGRGTTDLYRAYNVTQMRDGAGKPVSDLASQNRYSMQTSGEYSYFYVVPEQTTARADGKTADEAENIAGDASEAADEEAADEAAYAESDDAFYEEAYEASYEE